VSEEIQIYYNAKILEFLEMVRTVKVIKGGRGCGKTRAIPEDILDRAAEIPRARIFMASIDFDSIEENILPDMRDVFALHGLREDLDFVINKKPPPHFVKPYKQIEDFDHSIHLFNGFAVQMVSLGRNAKKWRGRSFDGGIFDEALNLKAHNVDKILMPTLRGLDLWGGNPYWKMVSIYSSHPRDAEGSWFLKYKKLAKQFPELYGWVEATAEDNLAVLGENYIDEQRAALTHVDFQIEILNRDDVKDLPTLFYHQYNGRRHNYQAADLSDVDLEAALDISFDFGGRFSVMTVSQESSGMEERILHEFHTGQITEEERQAGKVKKVPDIISDFCRTFSRSRSRHVRLYGEPQGLNRQAMDQDNNFEQIRAHFNRHGWTAEIVVNYSDAALHKSRYNFINDCLQESFDDYPRLRINELTCPDLCTALNRTRVTDNFKKIKRMSETSILIRRTHHTPQIQSTIKFLINTSI
jgi:hypothetical protein